MIRNLQYRGLSLVSRLIRWQTRSIYSHTAIMFSDGMGIEAWQRPLPHGEVAGFDDPWERHTPGTQIDVFEIKPRLANRFDEEAARQFAIEQIGSHYDWRGVWRFVDRRPAEENGKWFCSELVSAVCAAGGVQLLMRIPDSHVSPALIPLSRALRYAETITGEKW